MKQFQKLLIHTYRLHKKRAPLCGEWRARSNIQLTVYSSFLSIMMQIIMLLHFVTAIVVSVGC